MQNRIFSRALRLQTFALLVSTTSMLSSTHGYAENAAGFYTDPATGIVYRQETRTVERPVVETKVVSEQRTVYRPETVTETKPEVRTVYMPVVEHQWQPRLHGRWNPFRQPTVAYHHVPVARWEARAETIARTNTRTQWVAENRTVDVPQRIVRIERNQQTDLVPVGRVATPNQLDSQIASRLRPLDGNASVQPLGPAVPNPSVGQLASGYARPSISGGGMPATELTPSPIYNQVLPPPGGVGIATLPLPMWR